MFGDIYHRTHQRLNVWVAIDGLDELAIKFEDVKLKVVEIAKCCMT